MMESIGKKILSVQDVSEELGISKTQAYELFHAQGFKCFRVKGKGKGSLRITRLNFEKYLSEMEEQYERM